MIEQAEEMAVDHLLQFGGCHKVLIGPTLVIQLQLSVERLSSMKKYVFGLGSAQMKQVAGNTGLSRWRRYVFPFGRKNKECVPLNVEAMGSHSKGFLLDRIESLEDRLIQLSLEIETRRTSRMPTTSMFSGPREQISSYPVFNTSKPKGEQLHSDDLPISTGGEQLASC